MEALLRWESAARWADLELDLAEAQLTGRMPYFSSRQVVNEVRVLRGCSVLWGNR